MYSSNCNTFLPYFQENIFPRTYVRIVYSMVARGRYLSVAYKCVVGIVYTQKFGVVCNIKVKLICINCARRLHVNAYYYYFVFVWRAGSRKWSGRTDESIPRFGSGGGGGGIVVVVVVSGELAMYNMIYTYISREWMHPIYPRGAIRKRS